MNNELNRKVVYIVGSSRSGSTILNILLGNIDGVFAAGELNHYMLTAKNSVEYCSCGELVTNCKFWTNVLNIAEQQIEGDASVFEDQLRFFENWRSLLPKRNSGRRKELKRKYADYSDAYFNAIFQVSGKNILVDASKSPVRLFNLLNSSRHDYKIIHSVRDPRAVCVSLNRSLQKDVKKGIQKNLPGRPFFRTIKELYLISLLSVLARFRAPKGCYLRVRHEDLISDTKSTVDQLQTFLGIDSQGLATLLAEGGELHQSHNVAGNRLRMQSAIRVSSIGDPWYKDLSNTKALLLAIAVTPLQLFFRYPFKWY